MTSKSARKEKDEDLAGSYDSCSEHSLISCNGRINIPNDWRSSSHIFDNERDAIYAEDFGLLILQLRRPNMNANWHHELAMELEDRLYNQATSFDEYKDRTTLKMRLNNPK